MSVSSNEYKIMQLLWNEGRPLSRAEILKGTEGRNWNPASIHLILNSMISKGVIRITDEEKKYGRTYEASFSREEYITQELQEILPDYAEEDILNAVLDAYVLKNGKASKKVLTSIQKYVDDRANSSAKKKDKKS